MINQPPNKLIYIAAVGSSGSTLLSLALGAHAEIFSVGEIDKIPSSLSENKECSCSIPINQCPLWHQVLTQPTEYYSNLPLNIRSTQIIFKPKKSTQARTDDFILLNSQLLNQLEEISQKPIILDSSKSIIRWFYLNKYFSRQLQTIYLIRDGRAYIHSMKKRGLQNAWGATLKWIKMNLGIILVLQRETKGRVINIRYENFVQKPEQTLTHVCSQLGLAYDPAILDFPSQPHHQIAGSPYRFQPEPIKPDTSWQEHLTLLDKLVFIFLGGPIWNKLFQSFGQQT